MVIHHIRSPHEHYHVLIAHTDNAAQREKMACLLTRLFNGDIDPAEVFTSDYQQFTDGHALTTGVFVQHLSHVSSQIRAIAFTVVEIACHDELLADRHIVTVTYPDGRQAEIEVYLFAALREGKSGGSMKSREHSAVMLRSHAGSRDRITLLRRRDSALLYTPT